ncbi:MAG: VacB/RNase II family 3'-5' exoribonuclease, partial [Proteobacteria bacterium]|nr:VacB/RNase II family 3'-5' exoribonuclease [Pseudomonadota bacterium]
MRRPHAAPPRPDDHVLEGVIQHHGRFAFLISETPDAQDLMLRGPSLRLAMDGDRVQARVLPGDGDRAMGEIVRVVSRARESVVGVLERQGSHWIATPEEGEEKDGVLVLDFAPGVSQREGEIVVVKITRWPTLSEAAGGTAVESLGLPEEPGVRLRAILRGRDLPESFPEAVLAESSAFPSAVSPAMWAGRLDLRTVPIFTIDGADAKDFDDAVSLEPLGGGLMRLGVHIADVSYYVKPGTQLDDEASRRATSVYLADRVVPMLPPNLSDHLCSLMPGVERLTLSCFMDVDAEGGVRATSLKESVICSRKRFTYEEVEDLLHGRPVHVDPKTKESVLRMGALYKTLHAARVQRGALDMNNPEYKVRVDPKGVPIEVVQRPRLGSHRLIEEFMLLANETVATSLLERKLPFPSRVHPDPDPRRLNTLGVELKKMGVNVPESLVSAPSRGLQTILERAVGRPLEDTINMLVMRSLKQASYSDHPGGHFGLASHAYCHFTSPIRRYPDLLTHRAVRAHMAGAPAEGLGERLRDLCDHCSVRERAAAEAERKSVDILRAALLKPRVGQTFEGVVSGSASFGSFVTLRGLGAAGLARGSSIQLGSVVRVRLERVDEGKGELTLAILGPGPTAAPTGAPTGSPAGPQQGGERPKWHNRGDKPRWETRREKPRFGKPGDKPRWEPRRDKPAFGKPGDKPRWEPRRDKPAFGKPGDKPRWEPRRDKPAFGKPGDKPRWEPRRDKPSFGKPGDKPRWEPRRDKPSFGKPGDKPRWEPRRDKPSFG